MLSGARYLYLALVWLFLAGIVAQVFLAGLGLFGAARDFGPHVELGWTLVLAPLVLVIVAALARVGWRMFLSNVVLLVLVFIQPELPGLATNAPIAAALHPVNALLIFWLTLTIGLMIWRLVRQPAPAPA